MKRLLFRLATTTTATVLAVSAMPSAAFADETRDEQWMLEALDVAGAHEVTRGSGTRIGVLDSGVDADHPDLKGNVDKGRDMWNDAGDGTDDALGHGTAMASLLVGHGHGKNNADGVLGIAPEATVVPVTIYPEDFGRDSDDQSVGAEVDRKTAEGLRWLVDEAKVDVVLMAFGGSDDEDIAKAVKHAADKDVAMFAGTGNHKDNGEIGDDKAVQYPASDDKVTAVAGTTRNGDYWPRSNYGIETLISAPAEDIIAAQPDGKYSTNSGTSDSSAIVAGTAALMDSQWPDMEWEDIQWRLDRTADDTEKPGKDQETGYGIVNPVKALTAKVEPPEGFSEKQLNPSPNPRSDEDGNGSGSKDKTQAANSRSLSTAIWWAAVAVAVIILGGGATLLWLRKKRKATPSPLS